MRLEESEDEEGEGAAEGVAEEIAAQRAAAVEERSAALAAKRRAIDALAEIEPDFPEVLPGDSPCPAAADSVPPGARTLGREGWGRGAAGGSASRGGGTAGAAQEGCVARRLRARGVVCAAQAAGRRGAAQGLAL